jgi:hypothetical protein
MYWEAGQETILGTEKPLLGIPSNGAQFMLEPNAPIFTGTALSRFRTFHPSITTACVLLV